jgi:hypothetical protein
MPWILQNWKPIAVVLLLAAMFWLGWIVRGMHQDSLELSELKGADKAIAAAMDRESKIAANLETRLQDLKANEKVIEHEKIRIVDRPVYRSECIDSDGLRLINLSKTAKPPAKPSNRLP